MVRKRKNSEENTASPRQTRQITKKIENRNEPSADEESERTLKNVAQERGIKRTRRHHTKNLQNTTNLDTSFASELDASKQDETNKAIHKRATTRFMKKTTLNTNEEKLNSSQEIVVENSPIRTRKRAKKGTDELSDKSDTSIVKKKVAKKRSPIKVSKAKRTPLRRIRNSKSKITYESSFAKNDSENPQEGLKDKKSSQSSTLNSSSANDESDSMIKELTTDEFLNVLQKWPTGKNRNETPQPLSPRILRKRRERLPNGIVTPQNSPIVVNLTPHRSTKTPKRSPLNLRSPKSHSQTPLRLSKSPRKLPITLHSPAASDISTVSEQNSPKVKTNQTKDTMNLMTGVVKKIVSPSLARASRGSSTSPKLKTSPKYSKSPKIVLKSPKISPGNNKRSFMIRGSSKTPQTSVHSSLSKSTASPEIVVRLTRLEIPTSGTSPRTSRERVSVSASKVRKSPIKLAASRSPIKSPSRTPKIVSKKMKVRTPVPKGRKSTAKSPSLSTPPGTPLKTPVTMKLSLHGGDSPRRAKSLNKKRSPITDSGTPLRPISTPENISLKRSASKPGLDASSLTIPQERHIDIEKPLLSSTPRDRIARIMHLSPKLKTSSRIDDRTSPSNSSFLSTITLRENMDDFLTNCSLIENEEKPLTNETELINGGHTFSPDSSRKDGTFEITNDDSALKTHKDLDNDTYEVTEPKTPNFQKERRKRSMVDDESDKNSRQVKRTCRVRFARTTENDSVADGLDSAECGSKSSVAPSLKTVQSRLPTSIKQYSAIQSRKIYTPLKEASENLRRSTSMTNVEAKVAVIKPQLKRRSVSASDINTRTPGTSQKAQNASVSRLSRPKISTHSPKKRDLKTPVARKAPNFAEIHQKKFAKMESLVDAKKRVQERHIVLSNNLVGNTSKLAINIPSLSNVGNGVCNRFGFKLRKPEATEVVSKKRQVARPREKKKEENRTLLKGVRTNRRFELQMKSRNLHQ
ncbi:neurofilament heavy polypeptide [Cephus cinctus]|uniref:Neurofilament heavy polypeptide n=1 Tax=Cephus cinctus TaxID=211228 RepID=A0AAJ7BLQ8_CEPCN|nr:neurofilament heavy polypeptide [Cephus cinctus]